VFVVGTALNHCGGGGGGGGGHAGVEQQKGGDMAEEDLYKPDKLIYRHQTSTVLY